LLGAQVVGTGHGCRVDLSALRAAGFDVAELIGNNPVRLARRAEASGVTPKFIDRAAAIGETGATVVTVAGAYPATPREPLFGSVTTLTEFSGCSRQFP
jgi:hypothetical protein